MVISNVSNVRSNDLLVLHLCPGIGSVLLWFGKCFVFLCVLGGGRSHVKDSAHPRLHTQTAAREEEIIRSRARGHHVRTSAWFCTLYLLRWCLEGASHLPVCFFLQHRPHDSAGGRDRAGGVLQRAGSHRLRQIPCGFLLLAVIFLLFIHLPRTDWDQTGPLGCAGTGGAGSAKYYH